MGIVSKARAAVPLLLMLTGCGESGSALSRPTQLLSPVATGRSLVFVDRAVPNVTLLDVDALEQEPQRITLPDAPETPVRRPGSTDELLVLCRGSSDDPRTDNEAAALVVLDESGEARRYPLSTRFNAMQVSDDGRFALLYFDGNAVADSFIFNPNEIAIVDLDAEPQADENPRSRTLRSFGSAPSRVIFSPQMQIAGGNRRLAVVLFETVVLLIDLNDLALPEYTVELATSSERTIDLSQVVFDTARGRLYLRGNESNDVYVLTLNPSGSTDNVYVPSLNQLGIGAVPRDMALYNQVVGDQSQPRLLAITDDAQAVVVDTDTSRTTSIPLPANATSVQVFTAEAPFDPTVEPRAVLYAKGTSTLMFLDLDDVEERRARNLETLRIASSYSVINVLDDALVLLIHGGSGLSVLSLPERTASPISSNQSLGGALSDPIAQKLWLAPSGQSRIGFLDLQDFHPGAVDLERTIQTVVPVNGEGVPRLAVVHESAVGHITLIDRDNPTDLSTATAARGFLVQNVLDRAEEGRP